MKHVLVALIAVLPLVAAAQGRSGSDSPEQQAFDEAMRALNADDFAGAEKKFVEAIGLNPKLTDAYWRLASIHYHNKQYAKAVELLRRCPEPQNLDVREHLGLNLYKTANPPPVEAVKLLEGVVAQRPESFSAQEKLGEYYLKSDPTKATQAFEAYFKARPQAAAELDPQIHMLLGTAYVYAKDWNAAQREFENLLRTKPNDLGATLMLGTVYVGRGACSQAITLYEKLAPEAPKQPSIYFNLGTCYLKEHRPIDAQHQAEAYVRAKPNDAKGHVLVGDTLFEQKIYARALTSYEAAARLDATSGPVKTKIGKTYLALKNYNAAQTVLEQAAAAQPNDLEVQGGLAEVFVATNAPWTRLGPVAEKLAAAQKDVKAQIAAGVAFFASAHEDRAALAYRNALALEPTNAGAKTGLVKVLNRIAGAALQKNELAHAEELLTEAQRLSPDDLMSNRNLALVQLVAKRWTEAETTLQRALKKVPNDMVVNRLLARALLGAGNRDAAMAAYEKAAQTALRTRGVDLAGVYAELGPLYIEAGRTDQGITVLEQAVKEAGAAAVIEPIQRNLAIAYFRRGMAKLRDPKQADTALDDLVKAAQAPKGALAAKEQAAVSCGEAFAALRANKVQEAEEAFARAQSEGGCALKPPYDKLGLSFFAAYAGYRDTQSPAKRESAIKVFTQASGRSPGASGEWLKQLLRSAYELLAYDYYQRGDEKRAEQLLRSAAKVPAKAERRELDHNLAVIDLVSGRNAQAERVFDQLAGKPSESLVNLGILRDRQGDAKKALELYKRAQDHGARAPKLKEWIDVKERLFEVKS
jgi:tetratricopeptide (TPR) repeat protein